MLDHLDIEVIIYLFEVVCQSLALLRDSAEESLQGSP
jgi:hypothetical protein